MRIYTTEELKETTNEEKWFMAETLDEIADKIGYTFSKDIQEFVRRRDNAKTQDEALYFEVLYLFTKQVEIHCAIEKYIDKLNITEILKLLK